MFYILLVLKMTPESGNSAQQIDNREIISNQEDIDWQVSDEIEVAAQTAEGLSQIEMNTLENQLESFSNSDKFMFDTIKESKFWKDVLNLEWRDESRLEQLSKSIDNSVKEYLQPNLDFLDENCKGSISLWIQISLFRQLQISWWDFFESFQKTESNLVNNKWKLKKKNFFDAIWGLSKALWAWWWFLTLIKRTENLKNYLSNHQGILWNWKSVKLLNNPLQISNLLANTNLDDSKKLEQLSPIQLWLNISPAEDFSNITLNDKSNISKEIQNTIDSLQIKIDKKTLENIEKSTIKATELLAQRKTINSQLTSAVWTVEELFHWLQSSLGSFIPIPSLEEFLDSDNWILNFIFSLLGFEWWIKWLHKSYIRENIRKWTEINPAKRSFIEDTMKYLSVNQNPNPIEKTSNKFSEIQNLDETSKKKIPEDYWILKDALEENLQNNGWVINLKALQKYWLEWFWEFSTKTVTLKNWKEEEILDTANISDMDWFINTYLTSIIPELYKNPKFMSSIDSQDDFAFAIIWNLTFDRYFIDWVRLGMENYSNWNEPEIINSKWNYIENIPDYNEWDNLLLIDKVTQNKKWFQDKVVEISKELWINPHALMLIMNKESSLNRINKNSKSEAIGLIQFMPDTLTELWSSEEELKEMTNVEQLDLVKKYYENFKGKINSVKDLYLATFFPIALDHKDDPNRVFQSSKQTKELIASQNSWIDMDRNWVITMQDFNNFIKTKVIPDWLESHVASNKKQTANSNKTEIA